MFVLHLSPLALLLEILEYYYAFLLDRIKIIFFLHTTALATSLIYNHTDSRFITFKIGSGGAYSAINLHVGDVMTFMPPLKTHEYYQ